MTKEPYRPSTANEHEIELSAVGRALAKAGRDAPTLSHANRVRIPAAERDKAREDLKSAREVNSLLRRQLFHMAEVARHFAGELGHADANKTVLDRFCVEIEGSTEMGTGGPPLAPILLAELDRLRRKLTRVHDAVTVVLAALADPDADDALPREGQ